MEVRVPPTGSEADLAPKMWGQSGAPTKYTVGLPWEVQCGSDLNHEEAASNILEFRLKTLTVRAGTLGSFSLIFNRLRSSQLASNKPRPLLVGL